MSSPSEKKAAKPVEPQHWWEDVTPDMARTYLKSNTHNRPLDAARVSKYAADMRAGRWLVSPETISFDEHGVLLNGQHRLGAIVESGARQSVDTKRRRKRHPSSTGTSVSRYRPQWSSPISVTTVK